MTAPQRKAVFQSVGADNAEMHFEGRRDWTETVASCHTCQELLYLVMCEGDTCG